MTISELLKRSLVEYGYGGLYNPGECACDINNLAPCDGGPHYCCQAGYKHSELPPGYMDDTGLGESADFYILSQKNGHRCLDCEHYDDACEVPMPAWINMLLRGRAIPTLDPDAYHECPCFSEAGEQK